MIRRSITDDVPQMAALSEMKRTEYELYAPVFWRKAEDAAIKHTPYLAAQIGRENTICLVAEQADVIIGFVIANITAAPPVYDPGSLVCYVDDFTVRDSSDWPKIGKELLTEARRLAALHGANLTVVVCGQRDEPKRELLKSEGLYVASEWYVSG